MLAHELDGLRRLNIKPTKWGANYRVKVRNAIGRQVFITKLSTRKNVALLSKTYKIPIDKLKTHLSENYRDPIKYSFHQGESFESHLFEGYANESDLIEKIRESLIVQKKAHKVNIQLGYTLIERVSKMEKYYYPSINTTLFDSNIAVNGPKDIDRKVIDVLNFQSAKERVKYPSSAYVFGRITAAKLFIYYRTHSLGENVAIPEIVKNNRFIIDFAKTNNKCMFYCIAHHLDKTRKDRTAKYATKRFKEYCSFKGYQYSQDLYSNFKPIDIYEFHELEACFNVAINVFEMDKETLEIEKIRQSDNNLDEINILEFNGHAMYITDKDTVLNRYPCSRCDAIFETSDKLHNHKKSKCDIEKFDTFIKEPRAYKPMDNQIKRIISNYAFKKVDKSIDLYLDHFIVYDFESEMKSINEKRGENSTYTHHHKAMSVSVCDSLSGVEKCFINDNVVQLLTEMFDYIRERCVAIYSHYLDGKFCKLIEHIDDKMVEAREAGDSIKEKKHFTSKSNLDKAMMRVPVIGFNSGRYDLNVVKNELFGVIGPDEINMVIKNPSYMCISTNNMKMLDIINYLPAGTSYDSYLKTYLGECKCDDKIRCVCGLGKGVFCYEYITSFDKLSETVLPPKDAFDSKLKKTKCSDEDYERVKFVWDHYKMKSIKDLLIWYNNLDVKPFIKAVQKQREFYKRFELDMFADGVSLPSLAEKIMYQTCYNNIGDKAFVNNLSGDRKKVYDKVVEIIEKSGIQSKWFVSTYERFYKDDVSNFIMIIKDEQCKCGCGYRMCRYNTNLILGFENQKFCKYIAGRIGGLSASNAEKTFTIAARSDNWFNIPQDRFNGYKAQDKIANREFGLTHDHVKDLLIKACYLCSHCECKLTPENVSLDRIDNLKGHINGNIMISCIKCNVARKDMSINGFRYKKMIERNCNKLIWSIDEEESSIFHKMKANIAGGPSIIFNRYAKRNETLIRGGKLCKKIIGYDANALYLWAIGNQMPCGRLTTIEPYDSLIDDIKSGKQFGFLECDIETSEHLKDYFSEMTPIFKNIEIDSTNKDLIGKHMFDYNMTKGVNGAKKSRKLIGSYFGKQILIYTPLLKWYLAHGLVITKTYSFVKAYGHRTFKNFEQQVSDARRQGDVDESQKMIAEMMKLVGNSAFGRSGMDKSKHTTVKYESDKMSVRSIVEKQNFHDVEELNGAFEITLKKRKIFNNNPIHVSIAIYQLAKLRMLQFYYDFIDFYIDRSDFQYQEMDTDSAYIAFSDDQPFVNLIKPELKQHFMDHKYEWLPRDYNDEVAAFDKRKAGLFKEEWRGDAMVSLSSKNYICYLPNGKHKQKVSAKGVQQGGNKNADILNPDSFERVVRDRITLNATNSGFRIDKQRHGMITYNQTKIGLNYYYDKRRVLDDGITTEPLDL